MGKKIAIALCVGLIFFGMATFAVGYAIGGRPGSISVDDDKLVYSSWDEDVVLGNAPYWMRGWTEEFYFMSLDFDKWREFTSGNNYNYESDTDYSYDYDDDYDYDYDNSSESKTWFNHSGDYVPEVKGEVRNVAIPAGAENIKKVDIEISAGYVNIVKGDTFSITVQGPLQCTAAIEEGELKISSIYKGLTNNSWKADALNKPSEPSYRIYLNGKDITTIYTITLPDNLTELDYDTYTGKTTIQDLSFTDIDLNMNAGELHTKNITAVEGDFHVDAGYMMVKDSQVDNSSFSADAGMIEVIGYSGSSTSLDVSAGLIEFNGSVATQLEADCDAGKIKITHPRPAQYSWASKADLGTVNIDGNWYSGSKTSGGSATPHFDLSVDLGLIELIFK